MSKTVKVIGGIFAGVVILLGAICAVSVIATGDPAPDRSAIVVPVDSSSPGSSVGKAAAEAAKKVSPKPHTLIPDGQYQVGTDVQSGTYTMKGADEGAIVFCIWTVKASDDPGAEVLAFGSVDKTSQPGRVKLKKGNIFETSGCQDWRLTS